MDFRIRYEIRQLKKMLLSIIIVNYKTADLVTDCIGSIKNQKIDCEVIIVDNDSGEYDRDILLSLQKTGPDIKTIFNEENKGFSRANNDAIAYASGEYLLFLNPDTYIFDSCLEQLVYFCKSAKNIGAVTPKLWIDKEKTFMMPPADMPGILHKTISSSFPSAYWRCWIKKALTFWNAKTPLKIKAVSGAFILTKKQVMENIGNFDERFPLYFEDSDLCRRITKAGFKLFYYPESEAVHYYNQSAQSSEKAINKFIVSEKLYMQKYYHPVLLGGSSFLSKLHIEKRFSLKDQNAFTPWDYAKPLATTGNGYLLFSPLPEMIPCAAHKIKEKSFLPNDIFIDKLAKGSYYFAIINSQGKIHERYRILKK